MMMEDYQFGSTDSLAKIWFMSETGYKYDKKNSIRGKEKGDSGLFVITTHGS